jgi:hypothetical protein
VEAKKEIMFASGTLPQFFNTAAATIRIVVISYFFTKNYRHSYILTCVVGSSYMNHFHSYSFLTESLLFYYIFFAFIFQGVVYQRCV